MPLKILTSAFISILLLIPLKSNGANPEQNSINKLASEFFGNNTNSKMNINPSGSLISYSSIQGDTESIIIVSTKNNNKYNIFNSSLSGNQIIQEHHWIDNNNIIIEFYDRTRGSALFHIQIDSTDEKIKIIKNRWLLRDSEVLDRLPKSNNKFLISRFDQKGTWVYLIDLSNKKSLRNQLKSRNKLNLDSPDADNWLADSSGNLVSAWKHNSETLQSIVWVYDSQKDKWLEVWSKPFGDKFTPALLKDNILYATTNHNSEYSKVIRYNIHTQTIIDTVIERKGADIDSLILNAERDKIIGYRYTENGIHRSQYTEKIDSIYFTAASDVIPNFTPVVIDQSLDRKHKLIYGMSPTIPASYFYLNTDNKDLYLFENERPGLIKYATGSSDRIVSKGRDGIEVESFLYRPNHTSNENLPLIVIPHGGPISVRDNNNYDRDVQFLVTLGYAVLQTNYRGSKGYGKSFVAQGMQQWGRLIEDDIETAVKSVIENYNIDEKMICIFGMSYGGYSALMSIHRSPDIYTCAASYAGVTDLPLLVLNHDMNGSNLQKSLIRDIVGDPDTALENLISHSPVYLAESINSPIFLAQGGDDDTVDSEHFFRMKRIMDHYNKDIEYMFLENEIHGFRYTNTKIKFYSKLDYFFRKSLKLPKYKNKNKNNSE